jgi:hypothetical protein
MRYLLFICGNEEGQPDASNTDLGNDPELIAWDKQIAEVGSRAIGARLRPTSDATTVRVRDGEVLVTDGPFAETAEQIGGFDLIDCPGRDEALAIAAKHPAAPFVSIEVRALWDA